MYLTGQVYGATTLIRTIQVGAFSTARVTGQPVSLTTADENGAFRLSVPPGSWYLHAVGGPTDSVFLEGTVWGTYGGIYGQGRPIAVCHTPVTGLRLHVSPLWRDLTHVAQHRQPALSDEQRTLVYAARAALVRELADRKVAHLEQLIGLSRSRLASLFKRAMGLTMVSFRNQARLEVAKGLLATTDAAVLDIALEVGYSTAAALTRVFQPAVGVAPAEFRRLAREAAEGGGPAPGAPGEIGDAVERTVASLGRTGGCLMGELLYDGIQRGAAIYLFAIPRPDPTAYPTVWTSLSGPGRFTLPDVPPGRYFLAAYYCRSRMQYPGDVRTSFAHGVFGSETGSLEGARPIILHQGKTVGDLAVRLGDGDSPNPLPTAAIRALLTETR